MAGWKVSILGVTGTYFCLDSVGRIAYLWGMKSSIILALLLFPLAASAQTVRIDSMHVDEARDQLLIYGKFGGLIGSVSIGGENQVIDGWTSAWIKCLIPDSGNGSFGLVVVSSDSKFDSANLYRVSMNLEREKNLYYPYPRGFDELNVKYLGSWFLNFRSDLRSHLETTVAYSASYEGIENHYSRYIDAPYYLTSESGHDSVKLHAYLRVNDLGQIEATFEHSPDMRVSFAIDDNGSKRSGHTNRMTPSPILVKMQPDGDTLSLVFADFDDHSFLDWYSDWDNYGKTFTRLVRSRISPNVMLETANIVADQQSARIAVSVWPNPTHGNLLFAVPLGEQLQSIRLTTIAGSLARAFSQLSTSLDISDMPKGFYLLEIITDLSRHLRPVILE
jgi:hypothetical protein